MERCGSGAFPFSIDLDGDGWIRGGDLEAMLPLWGLCWNGTEFTVAACAQ